MVPQDYISLPGWLKRPRFDSMIAMAKTKTAKKSTLGLDPFRAAKPTAPMKLLSLDPRAVAPKAPTVVSRPEAVRKPVLKTAMRTVRAEPEPADDEAEAPSIRKPVRTVRESAFSELQNDLTNRLQTAPVKDALLNDHQMSRIEDLISRLEKAELPEQERGLFERFAKAWRFYTLFGRSMNVDDFGLDPRFEELVNPIFEFLYSRWWRIEVSGLENVPSQGRGLLVANHSGMLPYDGGMIKHAIRTHHPAHREVRPLVEDFVYHFPFLGSLMARMGGVRACQENAQRLLEKDELAVVFPEGVKGIGKYYRQRYQLQRFGRGGFVKLCLRTGAQIIPTAVVGAEEIHPIIARADFLARPLKIPLVPITPTWPLLGLAGLIPLPTKWTIHFGRPIDLRSYGKAALDDELLINKITADVRTQIQELIYEQLKKRRSVFFG